MSESYAQCMRLRRQVLLPGMVEDHVLGVLSNHLIELAEEGKTFVDDQCPLSPAIYGIPAFDLVMERYAPLISKILELPLLPTYTYARFYQQGDHLERHTDRAACEFTVSLTLATSGEVWPIYVANHSEDEKGFCYTPKPGDFLVFKGGELPHWRHPFKGSWQTQLFLHYVDGEGPFRDERFDKRMTLGHHRPAQDPDSS